MTNRFKKGDKVRDQAQLGGSVLESCGDCVNVDWNNGSTEWIHERFLTITDPKDRPDWPLPSFDARDWAAAFCRLNPTIDEGLMLAWFANALQRGFDEAQNRTRSCECGLTEEGRCPVCCKVPR